MKKIFTSILFFTLIATLSAIGQYRVLAPELAAPADGQKGLMPDVILDWDAVSGSSGTITYEIQLDQSGAFTNPQVFETEFVTGIQMSELLFGQMYYWRVRAHDDGNVSEWSEVWTFSVVIRPVITKPSTTVEQNPDPTLEWRSISGIDHYQYQLDTVYYWNQVPGLTSTDLNAVEAFADTAGWIFGNDGLILFYNGDSVVEQTSNTSADLLTGFFVAADMGFAGGTDGTILSFNGTDWTAMTSNTNEDIRGLYFLAADNGYAVGNGGVILHYDGVAWTEMNSSVTNDLYAVEAADGNNVWAAGKTGTILYYDGASWTKLTTNTTRDLYALSLTGTGTAWAAGRSGTFVYFDGTAWDVVNTGATTKDVNSMEFIDANTAWAACDGGVLLWYDGSEWSAPSSTSANDLFGISFSSVDMGWLVGEEGTVILYDGEAFTSPMATLHTADGDVTSEDLINLLFGTRYYWRLRAIHSQDTSEWSAPLTFSIIASPELEDPDDGSTNEHLDLVLKWKAISDHVEYDIQVDEDPAFGSPITLTTEEREIEAEMLKFGINYNWRVMAIHANDESDWSEVWTFSTINQVNLNSPSNGSTDIEIVPTLRWTEIGGVEEYHVEVASTDQFTSPLVDVLVDAESTSLTVPVVLQKNATYYWRVRAVKGLDSTDYSQTWSFTTVPPVGIDEPAEEFAGLSVFPNPANEMVTVELNSTELKDVSIIISDLLGKVMIRENVAFNSSGNSHKIYVGSLSKGIYLLRLDSGSSAVVRKLVIEK